METEIKLLLPPASRAAVEAHPLFAAAPARRVHNVSTYYDTPDLALWARGVALRVRRAGDNFVQTVKSAQGDGSFASRGEWEWPVASDALDPAAVEREPEARDLVGDDLARVTPVFTTDVQRDTRILTLDGKTTVEASIDAGEVRAGARSHALSEVELELKGGPAGPLLRLAAELARDAALRIGPDSKSERGYALLTDDLPPHRGAADIALPADVALRDAFPALVAASARDFAADLSPAARGDVEGVHRLRAAIRKLRTLFVLFAPHIDPAATATFNGELRDLGRVLGGGRDWDVFLTETLAAAEVELGGDAAGILRGAAERRRAEAHAAVTAAVEGPVPTALLLGLSAWTADAGWLKRDADGDARLLDLLPGLLDRLERKALKRGRHLRSLDVEDRHALRKSLKKLRYACEDVASLYGRGAVHRYVATIKKVLQDLGHLNDAAVTEERVGDLAPADDAALADPATALLAWNDKRRRGGERDLRRRWRKFRHADPFWG
ncbi:CYTH and CHAD domain-containing protein [Lichenibacterium dinghuense]|uniref:CYTH and CHAD domain-containing protein n=1 Tax=Lichenibacterium dinghuense TaxID=2895977 RepID=UPI001F226C5F|nr:CYTH and CHAD domain-containing protein [Lichenibacterium sp. 6Y81]